HRHSLLPRRPQAGATRTDRRRPRGRARDPDVPPPRGRARLQLRLPPPRGSRVARAVRPVQPAVPREVPAGALRPALRPAPGGVVRAEAPRRGLRGDVRDVAHAPLALARALPRLARDAEAPVRGSVRARPRRNRAPRP